MTDIKDRIQKAIQLHNEGASSFSLAVIKLTFGISDPIQKKMILKAYQTGTAPCIDQEEEKKETKTSDDIASTLQQALEENAGKKTSAAFQFIDKPGKDKKNKKNKKNNMFFPGNTPSAPAGQQNNTVNTDSLPRAWHNEGKNPHSFNGYMYSYCFKGLWGAKNDAFKEMGNSIRRNFPGHENDLATADAWLAKARTLYSEYKRNPDDKILLAKINAMGEPLVYSVKNHNKKQQEQKQKKEAQAKHQVVINVRQESRTESSVPAVLPQINNQPQNIPLAYKRHQNDITGLTPCREWLLLIDESGNSDAGDFETDGNAEGIIAGVLMPAAQLLPKPLFAELHASTDATEERISAGDKLIENILTSKNCGVLALPIKALRSSRAWGGAIGLLVDLVLRLIPLDGKTKVKVLVENKDAYDISGDFAFLRDACYYQLMQSLPARAEMITLEMDVMHKEHPFNAYPDFVANSCLGRSRIAKERMRISNWKKCCFLNYPAAELAKILDYYYTGKNISPEDWKKLLAYDGMSGGNFISGILDCFGEELKKDVSLWEIYLNYTIDHLNSKAINLRLLEQEISYLMKHQPEESEIPPRLNLLWLTSQLATKNHHGELIDDEEEAEFRRLIRIMYAEDSALACWTTLHLAVAMTDSFDFARAKRIIRDFYDVRLFMENGSENLYKNKESRFATPVSVIPGMDYFAQMLSSYGQHEAFTGNATSAVAYFRKAIALFHKLSDKREGVKQISQTQAYLVLALLDIPSMQKEFQTEFIRYFGKTPLYAVKDYAGNTGKPYYHHLLVRALAEHCFPENVEKAYLQESGNWKKDFWHPWELIEFYRGVLSKSLEDKKKYMRSGYELAMQDGGATLRMIGCCILGALYFHDQSVKEELKLLTERVICELPKLGENRIVAMRKQIETPLEPMTYMKKVVPFNFR